MIEKQIIEKPNIAINGLDCSIWTISHPFKEQDYFDVTLSLYDSLGEMGEYYSMAYDTKPTTEDIIEDLKTHLQEERERLTGRMTTAREERYLKVLEGLKL